MNIIRKKVKLTKNKVHIEIPREYINKKAEIIVKTDDDIEDVLLLQKISIDTKKWKFSRSEIYGDGK